MILCSSFWASGQEIKAFLKNDGVKSMTFKEFKEHEILQLNDSSLKVSGYVIYFACDNNFHDPKDKNCNITYAMVQGNSLKDKYVIEAMKNFTKHFYIVFDYVRYLDKNGETKVVQILPGRIDITE